MKEIIIAIIGSSAFTALVSALVTLLTTKSQKKEGIDHAVCLLLLDALERQGEKLIQKGHISPYELKKFNEYYETYKKAGGDGYADNLHKAVNDLPLAVS